MKKLFEKYLFDISKIMVSLSLVPMWFAKIFNGVGHLPDQVTGEVVEVIFRHSMFENICDGYNSIFAYVSIVLAVVAAIFNIIALKYRDSERIQKISNIVLGAAVGLFVIMLLLASSVGRGY